MKESSNENQPRDGDDVNSEEEEKQTEEGSRSPQVDSTNEVFVIQNLNLIRWMAIGPSPVLPPLQLVGKTIEFHLPIILWQIFSFLVLFILFQIHL